MKQLMGKTTFKEICKIMQGQEQDIKDCFHSLIGIGLLFLPMAFPGAEGASFIANISSGAALLDAKNAIGQGIQSVKKVFSKKKYEDYTTKYEHAQIAHTLLVFSAFFDSAIKYLPNQNGEIILSENEKYHITEDSLNKYIEYLKEQEKCKVTSVHKELALQDVTMPNPVESLAVYEERLEKFYKLLTENLKMFYEKLSFEEKMDDAQKGYFDAVLQTLPVKSVEAYRQQYYELAALFPDFFVWSNMQEHKTLSKQIDVGFEEIEKRLQYYHELDQESKAAKTLLHYMRKYKSDIQEKIFKEDEIDDEMFGDIQLPTKEQIFVPQRFKALLYRKDILIEKETTWDEIPPRENIGKFISDTLRNPELGEKPMLILGHPGAGKTTLCNMLAAKILYNEYHVIIVHLRDVIADEGITHQIEKQMVRDEIAACEWSDIAGSKLSKPLLIIFDGYDELLQATGKDYKKYLENVEKFQKDCKNLYEITVRCIVTSRIRLVERVKISERTPIVRVCDFEEERIRLWSDIWNEMNADYFVKNGLKPFDVSDSGEVYELAKQPLLLAMLALYDSNDNDLQKQRQMSRAELYNNMVHKFVFREKRKDQHVENMNEAAQMNIVCEEIEKLEIAALGMYNRNRLNLREEELERDTAYLKQEVQKAENGLTQSEKRFASFFFVYRSEAKRLVNNKEINYRAYEFMHNTFGEFLTADYIVNRIRQLLEKLKTRQEIDINILRNWYAGLIYAPLFARRVIVDMMEECTESFEADDIELLEEFLGSELQKVLNGEAVIDLKRFAEEECNPFEKKSLMTHLGIYSTNLIVLQAVVFDYKGTCNIGLTKNQWNQLLNLWKIAFSEDDIAVLASGFFVQEEDEKYYVIDKAARAVATNQASRLRRLYAISENLRDDTLLSLLGVVTDHRNHTQIARILDQEQFGIKGRLWWNYILNCLEEGWVSSGEAMRELLAEMKAFCWQEVDEKYIFVYYLLVQYLINSRTLRLNKQEMNQFLIEDVLPASISFLESRHFYSSKAALYKRILEIMKDLIEHIWVDRYSVSAIMKFYMDMSYLVKGSDQNQLYILQMCNTILAKAVRIPQDEQDYVREILLGEGEDFIRHLVFSSRPFSWSGKWFGEILKTSLFLLKLDLQNLGSQILMEGLQIAYTEIDKRNFSYEQKGLLIQCLRIVHERGLGFEQYTWVYDRIMNGISIERLYRTSPEIMDDFCYLMEYAGFYLGKDAVLNQLRALVQRQGGEISVRLYRTLHRIAENERNERLQRALDEVMH